jgi:hypothetical protein
MALAFPLTVHPGGTVMSPGVDTNLFIWTLEWNAHALLHRPVALFEANTFFPFHDSLAFSENLLGSSIIAAPIIWLGGGSVLAMNLVALTSVPLSAFGAFRLARELDASRHAALVAGIVFGFAPPRFFRLDQIHLTTVQWIPFALAFTHAYLQRGRARDLRRALAFFTLQTLCSGHGAVFLSVALVTLLLYGVVARSLPSIDRVIRDVGVVGVALLLPAAALLLPYHRVQDEMGLRRGLADFRIVSWQSFIASPSHIHRWLVDTFIPGQRVLEFAGAYLFPGIVPLLLAGIALLPRPSRWPTQSGGSWCRVPANGATAILEIAAVVATSLGIYLWLAGPVRWRIEDVVLLSARDPLRVWLIAIASAVARLILLRRVPFSPTARARNAMGFVRRVRSAARNQSIAFYALLTILCVWLSSPPPFGLWAYVYWLPGFDFIRAPSRFMILGVLALAVLAANGFDRLTRRMSRHGRAACVAVVGVALVAEFSAAPLGLTDEGAQIPAIDRWLASKAGPLVVAEVPVDPRVSERDLQQSTYMRHSMAHWHRTVHGYSGIHPPLTEGIYEHLTRFPDAETIRALQSVGVTTVVVHLDAYAAAERPEVVRRIAEEPALQLEHSQGDGRVYALAPGTPNP